MVSVATALAFDEDAGVPLYLVRWPDLSAALVNARNEDELLDSLDQVSNPEGCTWSVYRGPLHLELRVNADVKDTREEHQFDRPLEPADLEIGDVSRVLAGDLLSAEIPNTDVGHEMAQTILRTVFPSVHDVIALAEDDGPNEAEVREAIEEELEVLVRSSWRVHQTKRRPDLDSQIAAQMGTSPKLVARWTEDARVAEERPPPKPAGGGAKKRKATKPKKPAKRK